METQVAVSCSHGFNKENTAILHPKDILDAKRVHWETVWSPPLQDSISVARDLFDQVRTRAQEERLPDSTGAHLKEAGRAL
eukprot:9382938-Pyramimonas_sp.AAC.1